MHLLLILKYIRILEVIVSGRCFKRVVRCNISLYGELIAVFFGMFSYGLTTLGFASPEAGTTSEQLDNVLYVVGVEQYGQQLYEAWPSQRTAGQCGKFQRS